MKKILIAVTSCKTTPKGKPTGIWLEEYTVPYKLFKNEGYEIDVASIKGGEAPIDPRSVSSNEQSTQWSGALDDLKSTRKLSELNPDDYDAVFFPGGHGTMFDLPNDPSIKNLLLKLHEKNKVIAAVCHGPACFIGVTSKDGSFLIAGRSITGFTNEEEVAAEQDKNMPFLLEDELLKNDANYIKASKWSDHVEVDGNIITGQNPQSSKSVANAIIKNLNG